MARIADRLPRNAPGEFFVDRSCIDCDTCRRVAPAVFDRDDGEEKSVVRAQPRDAGERRRALMALVACPTSSIGTVEKTDVSPGIEGFPEEIADGVFECGFTSESSFGATSYLIRRPGGNVLVDSPRAAAPLLKRIEAMGGVATLFLTHRDDVADHAAFRARFGCERVMHRDDVTPETSAVERQLEGTEPVRLADDLLAIPVPGHTRGSCALLYRDDVLFTGDHLWWSPRRERLVASRAVAWFSWEEQRRSVARLLEHRFSWVLPGHGWRYHAPSAAAMRAELERTLASLGS